MNQRLAFFIDTEYCNNCKTCVLACKMERRLPKDIRWREVRRFEIANDSTNDQMGNNKHEVYNIPMSCNHCQEPKCVQICPVDTYTKLPNGVVTQPKAYACIGCTKCVSACPYSAPVYDKSRNVTRKCDMCIDRMDVGLKPFCVQSCPNNALKVDTYDNLIARYGLSQNITTTLGQDLLPDEKISDPSIIIKVGK